MKAPSNGFISNSGEEGKVISAELWHACAGPLVNVPLIGSLVVYFPQGHSEQVAASMQKEIESIPSYPNLPSKLVCMLHNVTLHADLETDEVYAQMTLQPVNKFDRDALLASEMALKQSRQPTEFFCKTLTASDTSTHGGFSVPRRAAEKIFPPLDFSMQPPAQEIVAKDLHGHAWTFRHIYRGQPKRHLLTTGWSVFVNTKRLFAGDSVLFIRDEKSQLLLGLRRVNRQQTTLASSVISSDSMHIGILAAAAHAASNNSPFTIFYNPRASPAEFVVPFAKYNKAMYTQVSLGMRFRMIFETEECGVRRYMGTVTGISDVDPVRWKSSQWRNLQVGWDESTAGDRPNRVSVWDIEPVVTPFYICPPPFFRPKFPQQPMLPDEGTDIESIFKRGMPWLGDEFGMKDNSLFPGLSLVQWMSMQQNNQFPPSQSSFFPSPLLGADDPSKLLNFQSPFSIPQNPQQKQLLQPQQNLSQNSQQNSTYSQLHQQQLPGSNNQTPQNHPINKDSAQITLLPSNLSQNSRQNLTYSQLHQQQLPGSNNQTPQNHPINKDSAQITLLPSNLSQNSQQNLAYSQLHQQQLPGSNNQTPQNHPINKDSAQITPLPPNLQFHQQTVHQQQQQSHNRHPYVQCQPQQVGIATSSEISAVQFQENNISHLRGVWRDPTVTAIPEEPAVQFQENNRSHLRGVWGDPTVTAIPEEPVVRFQKTAGFVRSQSCPTDVEPLPSCSTSPSTNNLHIPPSSFLNRSQTLPIDLPVLKRNVNLVQNLHDKSSNARINHDVLDANSLQQNLSIPNFVSENNVNNLAMSTAMDVNPDTLLFDSGKEFHNMFSNYDGAHGDMEAELSAMNSESFGVPNIAFKSGCSNDVQMNEPAVLGGGIWPTQAPRIRTYTKVQKRGSVGRCIDVTRYKGYDELRRDLARMFGIEGQLEDAQRREWNLVYVDHESDILLVGDDPWDEFVNCVKGIKILSFAEVQQMSLDGDLGSVPILPNQASSLTDSGNVWRGHYEDNSAASFNR